MACTAAKDCLPQGIDPEQCVFVMSFTKPQILSRIIDTIKDFEKVVFLRFSRKGLVVKAIESSDCVLVNLTVESLSLNYHSFRGIDDNTESGFEHPVPVDLDILASGLRNCRQADFATLFMSRESRNRLEIYWANAKTHTAGRCGVVVLNLPTEEVIIPNLEAPSVAMLQAHVFHVCVSELSGCKGPELGIHLSTQGRLELSTRGAHMDMTLAHDNVTNAGQPGQPIMHVPMRWVEKIAVTSRIVQHLLVEIYLLPGKVVTFRYNIGSFGSLAFVVAASDDEDQ